MDLLYVDSQKAHTSEKNVIQKTENYHGKNREMKHSSIFSTSPLS